MVRKDPNKSFRITFNGGVLRIECARCREACSFSFRPPDPITAQIEITCPKHGSIKTSKMVGFTIGSHAKPVRRAIGDAFISDGTQKSA